MTTAKVAANVPSKKIGLLTRYKFIIEPVGLFSNIAIAASYAINGKPFVPMHPFFTWWINVTAFFGFLLLLLAINQFAKGFKRARETRWEEARIAFSIGSLLSPVTWLIFLFLTIVCAVIELISPSNKSKIISGASRR